MFDHRTSSLRVRLLLLVLLAVLPAIGLLLFEAMERRRETAESVQEEALRLASLAAQDHAETIADAGELLRGLARLPGARAGDPGVCRTAFAPLLQSYPRYLNAGIVRPDGALLCSVREIPSGTRPSRGLAAALEEAQATDTLGVSGYTVGRVSGKPLIMLAQPIRDDTGAVAADAFAALPLEWLNEFATRAMLPGGAALMVMDPEGRVLVRHPHPEGWIGRDVGSLPLFRALREGAGAGTFTAPGPDGAPHLFASIPLAGAAGRPHGFLSVSIPKHHALAAADRSLRRNLLWLALIAGLALAAAWFGGELIVVRRVRALVSAAHRLRRGDLSARSGVDDGPSELLLLARSFDEMAEALQRRQEDAERTAGTLRQQALVFDTLHEGVVITRADHGIADWNPGAERLFGYSRAEVIGRSPVLFHAPESGPALSAEIRAGLDAEGRWSGEMPYRRKDGTRGISEVVAVAHCDSEGRTIGHVGVHRDVTERALAERALRESETRFRAVFENAPVGIVEGLLPDGPLRVNPAMMRFLGLESETTTLEEIVALTHPDDLEEDRRLFGEIFAGTRDEYRLEKRYVRRDGEIVWGVLHMAVGRGPDGAPREALALVENVTERRQAEKALAASQEELRHSQKMEAVGRLAGGVAHDFNNLLTAIRGNVELALLDLPPTHPVRDDLVQVQQAADTAASLTRQLLAFSRRQPQQLRTLDVNSTVPATAQLLQRMIGSSIELRTDLADDLPPVRIDPGQMEQILINLAVNARDAMPEGGVLRIEARAIGGASPSGECEAFVRLTVRDTGMGIDPELQPRIFEPFFTTKDRERGTGLGLFMVYGIVSQNGGRVSVESVPGEGTAFHLLLPVAEPGSEEPQATPSEPVPETGEETILLVDDEAPVRILAQRFLKRAGYRVLVAEGGEEALRIAAGHDGPVHLLLTDMTMPGMGGLEVARRVAELRPGIRVVLMSGYSEETIESSREVGALAPGFVQKPFTVNILARVVRATLDGAVV